MKKSGRNLDMVHGPLIPGIISFSLPLMATSILQLLYNAADIVVVGRYAGSQPLAAVGATGALISLLTSVFLGLSTGTSVVVARYLGARQPKEVSETVHTAVAISLLSSLAVTVVGLFCSRIFLEWMGTPEDVIDMAALYMRIYFAGVPGSLLYNFASAILRAKGDTRRPLIILTATGILNVALNLVFVICLGMDVDGVALATIISQYVSAVCVVLCLMRSTDSTRLVLRDIRIARDKLRDILNVGLPAGFQGAMFAISNVLVQSSLNSFGSAAVAGASVASNVESFVYMMNNALHQAAITFCSQNVGAKNDRRIPRVLWSCMALMVVISALGSAVTLTFNRQLLSLYNTDPQVLAFGMRKQVIVMSLYFLLGAMEVLTGQLRGMGYSMMPTIVTLTGVCAFRVVWLYTLFAVWPTYDVLVAIYPVTWFITSVSLFICYLAVRRKKATQLQEEST